MAFLHIPHVAVKGISACVPKNSENVADLEFFTPEEAEKFSNTTGVYRRRVGTKEICTSDLCYHAALKLMTDLNWNKDSIDCLIFVSQTPDYILPATSCILQDRLELSQDVVAFDVSLGCSGWIYGLNTIAGLLSHGTIKRGLLLVGDTALKGVSKEDKSAWPLFGDAGTATAIEFDESSKGLKSHMGCDGSGYEAIIVRDGGYRNQVTEHSLTMQEEGEGIRRNRLQTVMDGMNIFSFGITKAPESVKNLMNNYNLIQDEIDFFIFHQANLYMNEMIRKKLRLASAKVPYSLDDYGNTSSASIPLTICTKIKDDIMGSCIQIIACGFGVGLSWGSVHFATDRIVISDLLEI